MNLELFCPRQGLHCFFTTCRKKRRKREEERKEGRKQGRGRDGVERRGSEEGRREGEIKRGRQGEVVFMEGNS